MMPALARNLLRPLDPRQQRVLAAALFVLAVLLVLAVPLGAFYFLHHRYDVALAERQERLARFQRIGAQQPEIKKALDQVTARDAKRFFLKASVANLAGAELQDLVRGTVERNQGRISSIQVQPTKDEGRYRQVTVNVQLFANIIHLQHILGEIESRPPYLFVDNLTLRSLQFRGSQVQRGVEPEINVQMEVSGYALIGSK
jgi:general secretion pathway protein M